MRLLGFLLIIFSMTQAQSLTSNALIERIQSLVELRSLRAFDPSSDLPEGTKAGKGWQLFALSPVDKEYYAVSVVLARASSLSHVSHVQLRIVGGEINRASSTVFFYLVGLLLDRCHSFSAAQLRPVTTWLTQQVEELRGDRRTESSRQFGLLSVALEGFRRDGSGDLYVTFIRSSRGERYCTL
jgi:hypothetical protein